MGATSRGRLLIAEVDSREQARAFARVATPTLAIGEMSQKLRVGMILAETVVLTDAMVLDGAYFLALGPEGVLRELGVSTAQAPFAITGVQSSLDEALRARRERADHRWASADMMTSAEWTPSARVERVWRDWVDATESGLVSYEPQTPNGGGELRFGAEPEGSAAFATRIAALRRSSIRSDALRVWEDPVNTEAERDALDHWWSDAYLRLLAERIGADWMSFRGSRAAVPRAGSIELSLPERLKTWAEVSPPAAVGQARAATRPMREKLHRDPTPRALRGLAFVATAEVDRPTRARVLGSSAVRLGVALVLILCATPFVPWLDSDGPLAWLLFALAAATTVPYSAVRDLMRLFAREPHAVVVLHRQQEEVTDGG